jgi:hypothetical protein
MTSGTTQPNSVNLKTALAASAWLTVAIEARQSGNAFLNIKERVAIALMKISIEHRNATVVLLHAGGRTSAPAVARSAFEAYVLGLWVSNFSEEESLGGFLSGEQRACLPKFDTAVRELRKAKHPLGDILEKLRFMYKPLSDYAHGQGRQVSRWLSSRGIESTHSDAEAVETLYFVDLLAALASMSIERFAGSDVPVELLRVVQDRSYYERSVRAAVGPP